MALEKGALQFLSAKETLHHLEEVFLLPILPLISSSTKQNILYHICPVVGNAVFQHPTA